MIASLRPVSGAGHGGMIDWASDPINALQRRLLRCVRVRPTGR
jgi:hypothetical protein